MQPLPTTADIFLRPGDHYVGGGPGRIVTLLGSCVAFVLWHPARRVGGMCHYLLPERTGGPPGPLDGRYGTDAVLLLKEGAEALNCRLREFQVRIYGGASMLPDHLLSQMPYPVWQRNVDIARQLAADHGMRILHENVGCNTHRRVMLDLSSGEVSFTCGAKKPCK